MRSVPFPLVGGAYADESRPWSMQDTVNYLPTLAERGGTRSGDMLKTPPGLKPYLQATDGVVRGTYNAEGKFFAVMGSTLYRISSSGIAIPLGTVPGLGRVSFTHNQISLGNEVVVVNGSAGYVYNTVTDTFARITDPGYPGSSVAAFIDGYVLGIEPQGRYAFNSRPAAATDYNTLDRFTSEVSPDRLVSLGVTNNELLLLSASSGEIFQNEGSSEQPFGSKRITMDKGCGGAYTVVNIDNSLAWLGDDGRIYKLEGYTPRRISTRPIEQAIAGLNWERAFGFLWEDEGYEVAYWTFPDGQTWGWDASNGEWHRRESLGLNRWRVNSMTRWRGEWYAGDFQGPRIWKLDWDYPWEGDQEFVSERTCAVMHDNQSRVNARRLELVMDTGMPEVEPLEFPVQPEGPQISGAAPDGIVGEAYAGYAYTVTEGDAPIQSVTLRSGAIPTGLSLSNAGVLNTSAPPTEGGFTFTIRVKDTNRLYADLEDTISIQAIDWFALPSWINSADPNYRVLRQGLSDGATWLPEALGYDEGDTWSRVACSGDEILMQSLADVRFSANKGVSWTTSSIGTVGGGGVPDPAKVNGYWWVSRGQTKPIARGDGTVWLTPLDANEACLMNVVGQGDRLIGSRVLGGTGVSYSDNNGLAWTAVNLAPGATFPKVGCNDTIVVVSAAVDGALALWYSTNAGASFASTVSPFTDIAGEEDSGSEIIWAEEIGKFVVADHQGQAAYSADGISWTLCTLPSGAVITGMDSSANAIVAACSDGRIIRSTDGITFTGVTLANQPPSMRDVAFAGARS